MYHSPKNIAEAVALKVKHGENAVFSAGGTDLYPNMKRRQITPQNLIGLRELQELQIVSFEEGLTIGSGVSISKVAEDPRIKKKISCLGKGCGFGIISTVEKNGDNWWEFVFGYTL